MPVAIWFPDMKNTKILKILLNIFTNVTASPVQVSALLHYLLDNLVIKLPRHFLFQKTKVIMIPVFGKMHKIKYENGVTSFLKKAERRN